MSRILLCCGASAALYKACDLASLLTQNGNQVRTAMTPNAGKLVSPQLFEALTSQPAATSEWGPDRRTGMDHIDLARWTEKVVVAPASADLIARLALGVANDLVTTTLLAVDRSVPRLLCPAMNPSMLSAPAVVRNLSQLREDGWQVLDSEEGHLACGEDGQGRLADPGQIAEALSALS
ncbi:MAG TPA: hypothetical protein EYQ25_06340 [Planctomycetes bacterium]|nr:hypothetical protein [Planctomycetota bacterium]HIL36760.1 hypothetical protein [Planctomycetota bacterium]